MPPKLRGKWALGITPRNLTWIIKDKLAICERPGGFGANHRRVRRQEEIIWLRENDFGCVVSIIGAPHNLHNYDELNMPYRHRPLVNFDDMDQWLKLFFNDIHELLRNNNKVIVHAEEVSDRLMGVMGGYIRWCGLIKDGQECVQITEKIAKHQLDPWAREVILSANTLPQ